MNVACGVRCEVGYQLVGSSIRLCQENGTWSGQEAKCIVKTCPPIEVPESVVVKCSGGGNYVIDTVCKFSCQPGHLLVGSQRRNCLPLARWDGLHASCRPIFCPPLPYVAHGQWTPTTCTVGKQSYGTECNVRCQEGFQLRGPKGRTCGEPAGTWSGRNSNRCLDVTSPEITCPENIVVTADKGENFRIVSWSPPNATDNSGISPTVWTRPASHQPMKIEIGTITFTYVAVDASHNKAHCNFSITVKDMESPRVDRCESPLPFLLDAGDRTPLSWDPPLFHDNSGHPLKVQRFPDQDVFPYGTTEVVYIATDAYGNNSTCVINITVEENLCREPMDPIHGHTNCTTSMNALHCLLTCDEGYAFAVQPRDYFCVYDIDGTVLAPDPLVDPFPDCSVTAFPEYISQDASLTFEGDDMICEDYVFLKQLKDEIREEITNGLTEICGNELSCQVQNMTACDSILSALEEDYNIVARRRRRQTSIARPSVQVGMNTSKGVNNPIYLRHPTAHHPKNRERKAKPYKIELHFIVTGQTRNNQTSSQVLFSAMHRIKKVGIAVHGVNVQFHGESRPECSVGSVLRGGKCVLCPVGTYYNITRSKCESCPVGSYQPMEGSLVCLSCPPGTSTRQIHARHVRDCKSLCPPGFFGRKKKSLKSRIAGVKPCTTCDYGSYQSNSGQTECIRCPGNWTTLKRGSAHLQDCRAPCPPGEVSQTGLSPCLPCPAGFRQPLSGQKFCDALEHDVQLWANECLSQPCQNGGTCHSPGSPRIFICECTVGFMGSLCELQINECKSNPCLNGGSCTNTTAENYFCSCSSGFSGVNCELDINECDTQPCQNGATCVDSINSFLCLCPDGFTGSICTENVDECAANPCTNNGLCVDKIHNYSCECAEGYSGRFCEVEPYDPCLDIPCEHSGTCVTITKNNTAVLDYICKCVSGYTGQHCEIDVDDCASSPCNNNNSCIDMVAGFKCQCTALFTGSLCETELPSEYFLKFPTSGTTDYVRMKGPDTKLTQASICLWLKSTDRFNYGTVFSYATNESDNSFTLTDYNGFVLYINGERIITDVTANDGLWHSMCVTWSSVDGEWSIYIDGHLADNGNGLARGKPIPGNGVLILGQEQDSLGSGFNEAESFIGYLSSVAMWDYVLQVAEVWNLATLCSQWTALAAPSVGNIFIWTDFLAGIHGNLKIEKSSFCTDCASPAAPYQGNVTVIESTAVYICNNGFALYWAGKEILSTRLERKCLKHGDWEGQTPYCIRRSCGFPGYFPHGIVQGRSYRFGDKIKYLCNSGYQLFGNSTRVCKETGQWSSKAPTCQGKTCEVLSPPKNGQLHLLWDHQEVVPQYGHQVEVECNSGFSTFSVRTILTCLEDGHWDETVPQCKAIGCLNPPTFHKAQISNNSIFTHITTSSEQSNDLPEVIVYGFGARVVYSCDSSYRTSTNMQYFQVICGVDGQWIGESTACVPIKCPIPVPKKHVIISDLGKKVFNIGEELHLKCDFGYQLHGPKLWRCSDNGTWLPPENSTLCQQTVCPHVSIDNGYMEATNASIYSVGSEVMIHCDRGFQLVGHKKWQCTENGTWSISSRTVECQLITCNLLLLKVEHGTLQPKNKTRNGLYLPGDKVEVTCEEGYQLMDLSTLQCQNNGTWTDNMIECQIVTCDAASAKIENGHASDLKGFKLYEVGMELYIKCDEGYKLVGSGVSKCQSNGTWLFSGECQRITCNILDLPLSNTTARNGQLEINGTSFGKTINFICNQESKMATFGIMDTISWRCDSKGKWLLVGGTTQNILDAAMSLEEPLCKPIVLQCPKPKDPDNGYILHEDSPENLTVGSTIKLKCRLGYILQGADSMVCLPVGIWSNGKVTCSPVQCRSPPVPYHTVISNRKQEFVYGNMVTHRCREGYQPYGDLTSRCQANGKWSRVRGKCTRISCGRPKMRSGATVIGESYLYQDQVKVACPSGMEISSSPIIQCQSNGTWSDVAECKIV